MFPHKPAHGRPSPFPPAKGKAKSTATPQQQALAGLKTGFHSSQAPPPAKPATPVDPTLGLKDAQKASQVQALAALVAKLKG